MTYDTWRLQGRISEIAQCWVAKASVEGRLMGEGWPGQVWLEVEVQL